MRVGCNTVCQMVTEISLAQILSQDQKKLD